jgi:processive 1,2-diacylglycerol beta-glucosyltransferase
MLNHINMEEHMKVLILSISTGQGHHATGQAIENYFINMGHECQNIDAYGYIEPRLQDAVSKIYLFVSKYTPKASSIVYDVTVKRSKPMAKYSIPKITNSLMASELLKFIDQYQPDVIICTHVLTAAMMNILVEKKRLSCITVGIVTDFTIHPLWEESLSLDYYVTPSVLLEYQMKLKGMDVKKHLPFGIPTKPKFSERNDKKQARLALGLDPDLPTILLMSGSMGYGKMDKSIQHLDDLQMDFQTMVVCGNNKRQYKKINDLYTRKRFEVYGYVDNVDQLMDAADCVITKPGGITSSEALAKGLPMIMVNPIPGQEERNAEFMLNNGLALLATKTFPLQEAVFSIFKYPQRIEHLRQTIDLYETRQSTKKLCELLAADVEKRRLSGTQAQYAGK